MKTVTERPVVTVSEGIWLAFSEAVTPENVVRVKSASWENVA